MPWDMPWQLLLDTCFASSALVLARSAFTFACVDFLQTISVCSAYRARVSRRSPKSGEAVASRGARRPTYERHLRERPPPVL